ncbi:outer membrane protein assembly factor BamD [Ferruginibacter albus]|uniref:outer membrane protein assembly factor BamD n=1 Tax=Ferruginibacter albus TaxID=2875540 RepID=UPI001CC5F4AF|nr:outer membrane protein assembly factor BamD [Ferruginibacter albus]UAY52666.1 outer membrane protein assembly factor BamD [Ferruginibacter albus]
MRFLKIVTVVFCVAAVSSCNKFGKVLKSKDSAYKLEQADKYYAAKKYLQAQQLYEDLYTIFKGTERFEELYYKDAYCYYELGMYKDAENFFKGFLETFPNSNKAEEADYMRAYCFYKQSPKVELDQTATTKTIGMMQTFINTHPGSAKIKEATEIIDKCREKLELKEFQAAELYYKIGQYRAAALAYETVLNDYPESAKGDEYELKIVKSYYQFARLSIFEKQQERYEKTIASYNDFADRFPESKLLKDAEEYKTLSQNNIKEIQNEQAKTSTQR